MQRKKYEVQRDREVWTIEPNMFATNRESAWQVLRSGQNDRVLTGRSAAEVLQGLEHSGLADEAKLPKHLLDWTEMAWP